MGGSLTFGIRKSNGEQWARGVWTNSMFHYTANPLFLAEDPDCLQYYMDQYPENDKNDVEFTLDGPKKTGKPWWGYYNNLAPHYYGLVVIDFKEKKILSMQDYTSMDSLGTAGIELDIPIHHEPGEEEGTYHVYFKKWSAIKESIEKDKEQRKDPYWMSSLEIFIHYALQGKIYYDDFYTKEKVDYFGDLPLPEGLETEDDAFMWFVENYMKETVGPQSFPRRSVSFSLDLSPFEVINFDKSSDGIRAFHDKLLELGFILTEKDECEWKKFLEDRLEIEEESSAWDDEEDEETEENP